jgi:hypothetical protein
MEARVPVVPYPDPQVVTQRPLPRSTAGIVLGVLDNQKPNATPLLDAIVAALPAPARIVRAQKSPPIPASEEALGSLARGVDMTIIASAD